jgi:hypothetical protein
MPKAKVLVAGVEPGGAQCAAAAAHRLGVDGFGVSAFAKGPGVERFLAMDVPCTALPTEESERELACVLLDRETPDLVLTGTSMGSKLERWLWVESKIRGIPSAAILDAWINIGVRTTWSDFQGIPSTPPSSYGEVRPDLVFCPDNSCAQRLREEVGDPGRIVVSGHPWIEWVQSRWTYRGSEDDGARGILFLSEPLLQDYGSDRWGFTQIDVLEQLVGALEEDLRSGRCELRVRAHPREDRRLLEAALRPLGETGWTWAQEGQALEHATKAALTCGMTTMALLEAWACGCPTLCILPGLQGESPFLPDRMGWEPAIRNLSELPREIQRRLAAPARGIPSTFRHAGASGTISRTLEEMP